MTTTDTAMDALAKLMQDTFRTNYELLDIAAYAEDHRDRRRAKDALVRNEHALVVIAQYLASPPPFTWHLVSTPITWQDKKLTKVMDSTKGRFPVPLVELTIHT